MDAPTIKRRLVYGTYKLPQDYPKFSEILSTCLNNGIEWLDTAPIYNKGVSEYWIGKWQQQFGYKFKIATKAGKFYRADNKLHVSNALEDLLKSMEESLKRLKKSKLELLFLHDYEQGETKEDVGDTLKILLKKDLVQKVGLSNFPVDVSEYLINQSHIDCIQVDCSASDKEEHISLAEKNGIDCWVYRPFNRGGIIRNGHNSAEKVIKDLLEKYTSCRIIFGASEPDQIRWLEKI